MAGVNLQEEETEMPKMDVDYRSGTPMSQRMPSIASCCQKLREKPGIESPVEPAQGTSPDDTVILSFSLPERRESTFLLLLATRFVVLC